MHKYKTGGEVGNRMSNVIVKENRTGGDHRKSHGEAAAEPVCFGP